MKKKKKHHKSQEAARSGNMFEKRKKEENGTPNTVDADLNAISAIDTIRWAEIPGELIGTRDGGKMPGGKPPSREITLYTNVLCCMLLRHGGTNVVVPFNEQEDSKLLAYYGNVVDSENPKLVSGEQSNCHGNSFCLWFKHSSKYMLMTGYALTEDGLWRRHSWVMEGDQLIETTMVRNKYFGVLLTIRAAKLFGVECGGLAGC